MRHFQCEICGTNIYDSPTGYTNGCEHYPIEDNMKTEIKIGQIWRRKDGVEFEITAKKEISGMLIYKISLMNGCESFWKWGDSFSRNLTLVEDK